MLKDVVDFLDW